MSSARMRPLFEITNFTPSLTRELQIVMDMFAPAAPIIEKVGATRRVALITLCAESM